MKDKNKRAKKYNLEVREEGREEEREGEREENKEGKTVTGLLCLKSHIIFL